MRPPSSWSLDSQLSCELAGRTEAPASCPCTEMLGCGGTLRTDPANWSPCWRLPQYAVFTTEGSASGSFSLLSEN